MAYLMAGQHSELERLRLQSRVWEPAGEELLARRWGLRRRTAAAWVSAYDGDRADAACALCGARARPPLSAAPGTVPDLTTGAAACSSAGSRLGSAGRGSQGRVSRPHALGHDVHVGTGVGAGVFCGSERVSRSPDPVEGCELSRHHMYTLQKIPGLTTGLCPQRDGRRSTITMRRDDQ